MKMKNKQSYRSLRYPNKGEPTITPMKKAVAVALFINFLLHTRSHCKETSVGVTVDLIML